MKKRLMTDQNGIMGTAHINRYGQIVDFRPLNPDQIRADSKKIYIRDDYGQEFELFCKIVNTWEVVINNKLYRKYTIEEFSHPNVSAKLRSVKSQEYVFQHVWKLDAEARAKQQEENLKKEIEIQDKIARLISLSPSELWETIKPGHKDIGKMQRKDFWIPRDFHRIFSNQFPELKRMPRNGLEHIYNALMAHYEVVQQERKAKYANKNREDDQGS